MAEGLLSLVGRRAVLGWETFTFSWVSGIKVTATYTPSAKGGGTEKAPSRSNNPPWQNERDMYFVNLSGKPPPALDVMMKLSCC